MLQTSRLEGSESDPVRARSPFPGCRAIPPTSAMTSFRFSRAVSPSPASFWTGRVSSRARGGAGARGGRRRPLRRLLALLLPAWVLAGCDGDPAGTPAPVSLEVAASLALPVSAGEAGTLELRAFREGAGGSAEPLGTLSIPVEAGSRSWSGSLSGLPSSAPLRVEGLLTGANGEGVRWSGEVSLTLPATGTRGVSLLLRAGPPANAGVVRATFEVPGPLRLEVGEEVAVPFAVEGGAPGDAQVISLDAGRLRLLSVAPGSGGAGTVMVEGMSPGSTQLLLLSGFRLAQLGVEVGEAISTLEVTPDGMELSALGDSLALGVRALTPSGSERPLPGPVEWTSRDPGVAVVAGDGMVVATGNGEARIEARIATLPGVVGEAMVQVRQRATRLEALEGDGLSGVVGMPASPLPRLRALDARGNPVPGVSVTFATTAPEAVVEGATRTTDAGGEAAVGGWRFGIRPGMQRLEAVAEGGLVLRFTAQVGAGAPATLEARSPEDQEARVDEVVAVPPRVRLLDAFGNPLAGVALRAEPLGDRGEATPVLLSTDAEGEAEIGAWRVGTRVGTDTLRIRVDGVEEGLLPLHFLARVGAGDPAAVLLLEGEGQMAGVSTPVAVDPVFQVVDGFGNPVPGVPVTFTTGDPGGAVEHPERETFSTGVVSPGRWTLGTVAGPQSLVAAAQGATVTLSAQALVGSLSALEVVEGDAQAGTVGTALPVQPAVRGVDGFGNPIPGLSVTFAVTAGGGSVAGASATTDADGVARSGSWTLGATAGPNALTATAQGVSATFQATGQVGSPAGLAIVAGDGQSGEVDAVLPVTPRVRLTDGFGNPVPGASVTFSVVAGGGSLAETQATTGADGEAASGAWTLGPLGGPNRVRAAGGGFQVEFEALATVPCLALAEGESYETTLQGAQALCFEGGAAGAEFTWIPANTGSAFQSLEVEGTNVVPVAGPPSPFLAAAGVSPLLDPGIVGRPPGSDPTAPVHLAPGLRLEDALGLALAGGGSGGDRRDAAARMAAHFGGVPLDDEIALPLIPPGVPDPGDGWVLNVAPACSGPREDRAGTVAVVGTHVILVTDDANPPGGYTPGELADLAAELDAVVYPAVTGAFGTPTDLDGNGRIVVFLTAAVNAELSAGNFNRAFVRSDARDLLAAADCPRSNEGELLYAAVPDPGGTETFVALPPSVAFDQTARGVARELRNVIGAGARLQLGGSDEAPWLNAALNAVAEELAFFAASGDLGPEMNLGVAELTATGARVAAINRYGAGNLFALDAAVQAPSATATLTTAALPSDAEVGLAWAFLRYAADRTGGSQNAFWASLTQTTLTGAANLDAATGGETERWFRDFLAALYADDVVAGLEPRHTLSSWRFRDIYAGSALGTFALEVTPLDAGVPASLSLVPEGGSAFVRFGVAPGETGTVTLSSGGTPPTSTEPVIVIRTR